MDDNTFSLISAVEQGLYWEIERLIAKGGDVNVVTGPGASCPNSPLLVKAARHGEARVCDLLLKNGATVDARDARGKSALHVAAGRGHLDVCRVLIAAGLNVDVRDRSREETPLFNAVRRGSMDVFRFLVQNGADPDARTTLDATPLHYAAAQSDVDMIGLLLHLGVPANVPARTSGAYSSALELTNALGRVTALHCAVESSSVAACRLLVNHGADPSYFPQEIVDSAYLSPVQSAIDSHVGDVLRYFLFECKIDFGQRTVDSQKLTLSDLAGDNDRVKEWLRAAETQWAVGQSIGDASGSDEAQDDPVSPPMRSGGLVML